ncbi:MAG: TIGR01212 family radical SAM protein [Lachnospiraceae bacterium]|nr:TIGR01212 family radical SAM protein [Lachnospiraceae bacterium]
MPDFSHSAKFPSPLWLGKPYYSLDSYCKNTFNEKLYKISLDAGFTCPNRDGTISHGGCIFCSEGGSGDFAERLTSPEQIRDALLAGRERLAQKQTGNKFIAYFQAYTGTYGPVEYLESVYRAALSVDFVAGISIATRPDCLPKEVLSLLQTLKCEFPEKFIWIELGLQTIHESTARFIRRGYPLSCFEQALENLDAIGIPVIVHLILGLPGETKEDMLASVTYLNNQKVAGVKLQLLHILKNTELAAYYQEHAAERISFQTRDEYLDMLITCIEHIRPDIVLHRITGDAPKKLLIAPLWSGNKRDVLNTLHAKMKQRSAYQGKQWKGNFHAGSFNTL